MTLTIQNPSIQYTGDGATTVFTFAFTIFGITDLKVFVDTVQQVIYSDYTIENLTDEGGEVHLFLPPADLAKVLLIRVTPKEQQVDLEPFTAFPADTVENVFDRAIAITQELEQRFIDNVQPQVLSFNGRVGDIAPDITDYSQFYADLNDYNAHKANENAHHNKEHLLYGPDHSDVDTTETPEVGTGLVWTGTAWEGLNLWVASAYGGVGQFVSVGLPDIGASWVTLLFNAGVLNNPRGITQESTSNGIRFNVAGVYSANVTFTLTHGESNAGREVRVRLYNQTTDTGGTGTIIGIARNQPATNFSTTLLVEIDDAHVGNLFQIQIGDGDAVTGVIEAAAEFSVHAVSEYMG